MKRLSELLSRIAAEERGKSGIGEAEIRGLAYHSAKVSRGDLFFCIRGYKTDGHRYLKDAQERGAVAAIVEYYVDGVDIPQYRTADCRKALALLASAFYDFPAEGMKMIGVTATNGKTTTTYMINEILEKNHRKTGLIGTVMIKADDEVIASELTTPESLELQRYLSRMREKEAQVVTMEVSSSALELNRVFGIDFDIALFNNLSREHIDLHGSYERYKEVKSSLITQLGQGSFAVLNADVPEILALREKTKAQVITYSVETDRGDLRCENLDLSSGRAFFDVYVASDRFSEIGVQKGESFSLSLKVPGYHSVYNAMSAIAVALLCGVSKEVIRQALSEFRGVERRFELIYEDEFKVFDDHFANSGNIDVTLGTIEKMDYGKLVLLYAIRGNRGVIVNRENAEAIAHWAKRLGLKRVIATRSRMHTGEKDRVSAEEEQVLSRVLAEHRVELEIFDELAQACKRGLEELESGDVLLLAGCQGMDYGAEVFLEELCRKYPERDREELWLPITKRIALWNRDRFERK